MTGQPCNCVECRIRQVITGGPQDATVDIGTLLHALGNLTSEALAHVSSREAKRYCAYLLEARKDWQKDPRVAVQMAHKGTA